MIGSQEWITEHRKLHGSDDDEVPLSPDEILRGNEIGSLLQTALPYSICDTGISLKKIEDQTLQPERISASVTVHCAWTEYVSYVVYKVENGEYTFSRGKYPKRNY